MLNIKGMDVGPKWNENHLSKAIHETVFKSFPTLMNLRPTHLLYPRGSSQCESSATSSYFSEDIVNIV